MPPGIIVGADCRNVDAITNSITIRTDWVAHDYSYSIGKLTLFLWQMAERLIENVFDRISDQM